MRDVVLIVDILAAVGIVGLVLLQQGKGADMGAAFGSGASQTLFGARGSANFLTRATAVLATIFFLSNMTLAWVASKETKAPSSVTTTVTETPAKTNASTQAPPVPEQKVPDVPK
jgi:preprotein translocase subunit SecG